MAFASVISGRTVFGNKRMSWGTYTNTTSTGGDIDTGLGVCDFLKLQTKGGATSTLGPSILVDLLPKDGGVVTIETNGGTDKGYWWAFGNSTND